MRITTLADRPDLDGATWALPNTWPEFMRQDPVADRLFGQIPQRWPQLQLIGLEPAAVKDEQSDGTEQVVALLRAVAFAWDGDLASLPDRGWDGVLQRAVDDDTAGRTPTAVSLIEATVHPERQGAGLSRELIVAARARCRAAGFRDLFGPVRPSAKWHEPRTPITEYAERVRSDGLPADPWLRVHARLGGRSVRVCPVSMTIPGTLDEWRAWTGLPFDRSGRVEVPHALCPVHVDVEAGHAVYVEPNVWVHHDLR